MTNRRKSYPWDGLTRNRLGPWEKEQSRGTLPRLVIFIFFPVDLKLKNYLLFLVSDWKSGGPCTEQVP